MGRIWLADLEKSFLWAHRYVMRSGVAIFKSRNEGSVGIATGSRKLISNSPCWCQNSTVQTQASSVWGCVWGGGHIPSWFILWSHLRGQTHLGRWGQSGGTAGQKSGERHTHTHTHTHPPKLKPGIWEMHTSPRKETMTKWSLLNIHSCIGEGNGNPLQWSCLENPRDRGAWWAAVYRVTQSRTRLKRLSSSLT